MYELELHSLTASVLPDPVGFLQVFLLKLLPERLLSKDRYREYRITSVTQACVFEQALQTWGAFVNKVL